MIGQLFDNSPLQLLIIVLVFIYSAALMHVKYNKEKQWNK